MIRSGNRARPGDSIPASSMADIAFLLLIFFLVTTVFPRDRGLAMALPSGPVEPVSESNLLQFVVRTDGVVELREGGGARGRLVSTRDIVGVWREAVAANPLLIAVVRTDPDAAYRHMLGVLDQLQVAGARRISLQVIEP